MGHSNTNITHFKEFGRSQERGRFLKNVSNDQIVGGKKFKKFN